MRGRPRPSGKRLATGGRGRGARDVTAGARGPAGARRQPEGGGRGRPGPETPPAPGGAPRDPDPVGRWGRPAPAAKALRLSGDHRRPQHLGSVPDARDRGAGLTCIAAPPPRSLSTGHPLERLPAQPRGTGRPTSGRHAAPPPHLGEPGTSVRRSSAPPSALGPCRGPRPPPTRARPAPSRPLAVGRRGHRLHVQPCPASDWLWSRATNGRLVQEHRVQARA